MKKQVKVYKGYVPKYETLKETIFHMHTMAEMAEYELSFGMVANKREANGRWGGESVKRTITITSEDEEVK